MKGYEIMNNELLKMEKIIKEFSGVRALNNVNLNVQKGEIHALVGENGAGKSTLMNVLSGVFSHNEYSGEIFYNGEKCEFNNLKDSEEEGIVIIHQELALIPFLSITENIFLGNEQANKGVIDWEYSKKKARELLQKVGLNIDPDLQISQISVAQQQLVEIAKAISKDVKLLILDEPTASLNDTDSENLLRLIEDFKKQGITSIIISHKLNEIMSVADNVTIIRDGETIESLQNKNLTETRIIRGMVGRELLNRFPERVPKIGETILEVKNWNAYHPIYRDQKIVDDVSFHMKKGEIIGVAGLMGAGRTELAMSIFGKSYGYGVNGKLIKDGKEIKLNSPEEAIKHGFAYLSEDRKDVGLNLMQTIRENLTISSLEKFSKYGVLNSDEESVAANKYKEQLDIRAKNVSQSVSSLSGGNQQKVAIGKWLLSDPEILILDEPTRGVDVGAKYEIYQVINEIAEQGISICVISSELPEILGLCDRIYAMSEGKFTGELPIEEASQEKLMELMTINIKKGVSYNE